VRQLSGSGPPDSRSCVRRLRLLRETPSPVPVRLFGPAIDAHLAAVQAAEHTDTKEP
jgi:hypothetical protein